MAGAIGRAEVLHFSCEIPYAIGARAPHGEREASALSREPVRANRDVHQVGVPALEPKLVTERLRSRTHDGEEGAQGDRSPRAT